MPYNTRRKSLSLESLGIHVPNSSRSASHRSPPTMTPVSEEQPPQKKFKRSHSSTSSDSASVTSPSRRNTIKLLDERPRSAGLVAEHTPPPSPGGDAGPPKVDTQGIDDEIVVGVIHQLEKTGNRPHLLKELAAVLGTQLAIVQSSANPAAIISSRLMNYLKRNCWSALAPCPLERTLVGTHPKRIYFYLTNSPHQPIPEKPEAAPALAARIISPSLSSGDNDEGNSDLESRDRARMSPSPEIDLSSPDFEDVSTPFSEHLSIHSHPASASNISHNRRAQSPPLEREEREFTQIHTALQQRSRSHSETMTLSSSPSDDSSMMDVSMESVPVESEETEESAAKKNSEAAAALFGHLADRQLPVQSIEVDFGSSPMVKPLKRSLDCDVRLVDDDTPWDWNELRDPEHVELDELDDLFGGY